MELWSKIKGWLNIGGVDVKLSNYTEAVHRTKPVITGAVLLKTKEPKIIKELEVKLVEEYTHGKDQQRKTDTTVLGRCRVTDAQGQTFPLELKPGENREEPFTLQ